MADFSDFIVFADESGDHGMQSINPQFPVFSLVFCVFRKEEYANEVEPAVRRFKFRWFGHDAVILHEREIRKQQSPFDFLKGSPAVRARFFDELTDLMSTLKMFGYVSVIDKAKHRAKYATPWNPYEIAMHFCMERLCDRMLVERQRDRLVHVLFESRGVTEDRDLELEFRRVASNQSQWGWRRVDFSKLTLEPVFVSKAANLAGHQITDLVARPLALMVLRPDQPNRAVEAVRSKIYDLKVFP
ncbi:MAG: DUF3800 domain-containing protein [Alphaproteobacteria bacterium]|nr:DUF3800 domain-containing protein [Alphaproteobacteria bacterium]